MPDPQVVPILIVPDLDVAVPFYEALGFVVTYRQQRPNPYAAMELAWESGTLPIHLTGVPALRPEDNPGSVLVVVDDSLPLHAEWSAGLRAAYGRVPVSGFPRMTKPRVRAGGGAGFSVVDPGGNWLRVTVRDAGESTSTGLARVVEVAARQGDARGDDAQAITVLEAGLLRHPDAPEADRQAALEYLAELRERTGQSSGAPP